MTRDEQNALADRCFAKALRLVRVSLASGSTPEAEQFWTGGTTRERASLLLRAEAALRS
jgi:hypothetical protein